jgi:hypothetical protein
MAAKVLDFLAEQLADPETAWSIGTFGAIAEFMREADEPTKISRGDATISAATDKGAIRINAHPQLRPFASESLTTQAWSQRVSLCMPYQLVAMNQRMQLTELGPDRDAVRAEDRAGVLFDIGLGTLQIDACIRSSDPATVAALRGHAGKSVFAADSGAMAVILRANPHRVFVSRLGRVEVYQPIPQAEGKSPDGPHTHVLPKLLAHRRTHAATELVPGGFIPCAHLYPPHPMRDVMGHARSFQADQHISFQNLLGRYGDPEHFALKRRIIYAVTAGHQPDDVPLPSDRFSRATARITLRQLRASDMSSSVLETWLAAHDRSETQQDPMEALH